LAHLLGDFPLQTSSIVRGKARGIRAYLLHGAIHLLVLLLSVAAFGGLQWLGRVWFWILSLLYVILHLGIDGIKQRLIGSSRVADSTSVFVVDQALHVCTIVGLALALARPTWPTIRSELTRKVYCEISRVERTLCRVLSDRDVAEYGARGSGGSVLTKRGMGQSP
jgi:hypothetical protein